MDKRTRQLIAQFGKDTKTPNEFIKFAMSETDPSVWYALLHGFSGADDEFAGGEYLVRIVATEKFPYDPPWFYFMTENGVYGCEKKVCISIGGYHSDQFRAVLSLGEFAKQLVSGMIGWRELGGGIQILSTTAVEKKALAAGSHDANMRDHAAIMEHINETYKNYSAKWLS